MAVMLLVGVAGGANAQVGNPTAVRSDATINLSDSSFSTTNANPADLSSANFSIAQPEASPAPAAASPAPAQPKYVFFGDRDDYRWQLGVGVDYIHFSSRAFDANMVGLNTTLTYYTNTWFALEGSVITGFGSDVFNNDSNAKMFGGAGGIRIGGRRARWEPFGHALVGGAHLQPQTAYGSRNSLLALAGGGVDFRVHSRLSLRGEADWVYTNYFSDTQNNFQIVAGVVFHF